MKFSNLRLNILNFCFFCVALLFIIRLFFIQVLDHNKYKAMAEEQYWALQEIPAKRGDVLSSDGFSLASTQTYYFLYTEPKKIKDFEDTAIKLSVKLATLKSQNTKLVNQAIENSNNQKNESAKNTEKNLYDDFYEKYKTKILNSLNLNLQWVILEHNLSPIEKDEIESLNIAGVGFEEEPVRFYPEGKLASHVLGFVASNEKGEKQGYYGIEGMFNGDLKGKSGRVIQEKDAMGDPILIGGYRKVGSIDGGTVVLTINRSIQYAVEKRLKEAVENYDALSGSVIVMDPFTGDILALANYPTYDPSDFTQKDENDDEEKRKTIERKNLAISETYEPGSVIKGLTISAGIDLKKITPETTYEDNGPVKYSDYYVDNWNGKHYGILNIIQLLQKSNNIGAAWVGHLIGAKSLSSYFENFGLGQKTGIDLEGEDTGNIRNPDTWTDIDIATASFGQGISATPLQVLNGYNVIANGGTLIRPRVVSKITENGKTIVIPVKPLRRIISQQTSDTMVNMLTQAVSGGESKYFNLKNYKIAGKTGTAQIPFNGKYDPQKTNATFVGFMAVSKKFSMIVKLNRPTSSIYAAETAAPLWMHIADDLVKYYGIPPDQ